LIQFLVQITALSVWIFCKTSKISIIFLIGRVHFLCRHVKLPTIDSLPLCPVFKGAKKTDQQGSGERKGSLSLAASLLVRLWRTFLRCSK